MSGLAAGEVGLQDDGISLSAATLAALREFALEKGVSLGRSGGGGGGDSGEQDGSAAAAVDVVRAVQQHFDVKEKETVFHITHGDVALELMGLKRELGQTLDSTGLTIWRAADHLCEYVAANRESFRDRYVCELGCGLGVVAILLDKLNVGATIVATDGDDMTLDLLNKNINGNGCSERLCARKLWWSEAPADAEAFLGDLAAAGGGGGGNRRFDVILAADVIYDDAAVLPLAATAAALLARPGGEMVLGFSRRNVPIGAFHAAAAKHGLAWETLRECGGGGSLSESEGNAFAGNEAIYRFFWKAP